MILTDLQHAFDTIDRTFATTTCYWLKKPTVNWFQYYLSK